MQLCYNRELYYADVLTMPMLIRYGHLGLRWLQYDYNPDYSWEALTISILNLFGQQELRLLQHYYTTLDFLQEALTSVILIIPMQWFYDRRALRCLQLTYNPERYSADVLTTS